MSPLELFQFKYKFDFSSLTKLWPQDLSNLKNEVFRLYTTFWKNLELIKQMIHTNERRFTCDRCYQSFKRSEHLKVHNMGHTGEKSISCFFCEKGFKTNAGYKTHLLVHSVGEKSIVSCPQCEKIFNRPDLLNRHILDHTGKRPHPCIQCEKTFKTEDELKSHSILHTSL